jgi:tellurite resistance protein TerC
MFSFLNSISVAPSWLWLGFVVVILVLLIIDLSLFSRLSQKKHTKIALIESALWILLAIVFNIWFGFNYGLELGIEFFTGYLVEKTLSVDNIFVILLIFTSFKIPREYQHRVLFYGVLGAIIMRGSFILLGAQLMHNFKWIIYVFGAILIITGIKLLREADSKISGKDNILVKFIKKFIPTTDKFHGNKFFIKKSKKYYATPLFMALIVIEATDLIFAVDSVPAVFAVTNDAFVAFSSNILAILGLRALYFVFAEWIVKLKYLKPGLAVILSFIGLKMILIDIIKIPGWMSLMVIILILTTAGLGSWYSIKNQHKKSKIKK